VKPGAQASLDRLDADIAAKTRVGRNGGNAAKPGAQASLDRLDADIAAKSRSGAGRNTSIPAKPGAQASLDRLDADIAAKSRAVAGSNSAAPSKPGAQSQLERLDADIAAKTRANAGASGPASRPGAQESLDRLDADIAAKTRGAGAPKPAPAPAPRPQSAPAPVTRASDAAPLARAPQSRDDAIAEKMREAEHGGKESVARPAQGNDSRIDEKIKSFIEGGELPDAADSPADDIAQMKENEMNRAMDPLNEKFAEPPEAAPGGSGGGGLAGPDLAYGASGGGGYGEDGLAIAVAVEEDEEDAFIPAAVEYEPDAKPPMYKNRRFRLYVCAGVFLFAVAVAATVVGVLQGKKEKAPTLAPTTIRESLGIQEQLIAVVGVEKLLDKTTSEWRAANWLINEDPLQLSPEADNLIQRYLLAFFHIDTTQLRPWLSCNRPIAGENSTCQYKRLVRAFPDLVYEQIEWFRWQSDIHECAWAGVFCDEFNQTRALDLSTFFCWCEMQLFHSLRVVFVIQLDRRLRVLFQLWWLVYLTYSRSR